MRTWTSRRPDWDRRFTAWLEANRDRKFEWGVWDCMKFGLGGIEEVTGHKPLEDDYVYWSADQAAAWLRDQGFASLRDAVTYHVGRPFQNYRDARRGDAALVEVQGIEVLATVTGEKIAAPGSDGLVFVPLSAGRCFWRI